jgi:7-cyano-7-deazaguanine synthase
VINYSDISTLKNTPIAILFSGGLDSTVALSSLRKASKNVIAIEVNYPGRPHGERKAASEIVRDLGVDIISFNYAISRSNGQQASTVPLSAMLLVSICDQIAAELKITNILLGTIQDDWKITANPQAGIYYYESINRLLKMHRAFPSNIHLPFYNRSKLDVVQEGNKCGAPFELTWSCTNDFDLQCGKCASCLQSANALKTLTEHKLD